jgi:hypothetical protein
MKVKILLTNSNYYDVIYNDIVLKLYVYIPTVRLRTNLDSA